MLFALERRRGGKTIVVAFSLVVIATCCVLSYLTNRDVFSARFDTGFSAGFTTTMTHLEHGINVTHGTEQSFPLPDAQHPVVTISSLSYFLSPIEGEKMNSYLAMLKHCGFDDRHDRPITLRYRSNTSVILEPRPDAGRLTAIFIGRTGNRMYTYAALYGIARRSGMRPVISANNPLLKLFHLNVTVAQSDRPGRGWVQYVPKHHDRHMKYLDSQIDVELVGMFNGNWALFGHVMQDLVQNHFRFREAIQQEADNFLRRSMAQFDLSPSDVAVIAVHIRRTDLLQHRIQKGILPAGKSYFSHAVAFFNRRFDNKTMYIVCSDDLKWSKVNFVTESPTVFSVGHSADVDFAILSRCNHSILTIGSFGQWSAYLAGGVTVSYKDGSPTDVPLEAAYRKVNPPQNPRNAWIQMS